MTNALTEQKMARTNDFRVLVVLAAMALATALLVLFAAEKPAKAAFPGKNGLIVFTSDRDSTGALGNDDIYAMAPDGSKTIRLTTTTDDTINQFPALSPDGTKVAFHNAIVASFPTSSEIWRTDVEDNNGDGNGDNLTQLTKNSTRDSKPAWSPDGKKIAFVSRRKDPSNPEGDFEIYVMNLTYNPDGTITASTPTNLTHNNFGDITPDRGRLTERQCTLFAGGDYIYDVLGFASADACKSAAEAGG